MSVDKQACRVVFELETIEDAEKLLQYFDDAISSGRLAIGPTLFGGETFQPFINVIGESNGQD